MSAEDKAIVRRLVEEGFNQGNLDAFDELVSPNFVNHSTSREVPPTREGWKQTTAAFLAAFPDLRLDIEDEIVEGDRVVIRFTACGTQQGKLMGIPASGKEINVAGISILRIAGGKIAERWEEADMLGLMQQIGAIPPAGG